MNVKCFKTIKKGYIGLICLLNKGKQTINIEKPMCMYQEYLIVQLYQVKIVEVLCI